MGARNGEAPPLDAAVYPLFFFLLEIQFVGLRFSLADEARRSTRWETSDFPRGGRLWMGPLWMEGLLAFSSGWARGRYGPNEL